jgi:hypothetical protein
MADCAAACIGFPIATHRSPKQAFSAPVNTDRSQRYYCLPCDVWCCFQM